MTIELTDVTVIGGVDTYKHTHYVAAIDDHGRLLSHHEFSAAGPGYVALRSWMRTFGTLTSIGWKAPGRSAPRSP